MKKILFVLVSILLSACSYNATVMKTTSAASEIRLDRHRDIPVTVVIEDEIENLNKEVDPSTYVCSAHNFPLEIGTALRQSIYAVMESAFSSVEMSEDRPEIFTNEHTFVFSLDSFDPQLHFNMGFWSSKASANVEIVLKVTVYSKAGDQLFRTSIAGDGSAGPMSGGCNDGAQVLADASQEAIEDMLERFVFKVINSDQL